jgi:hypothetical protein
MLIGLNTNVLKNKKYCLNFFKKLSERFPFKGLGPFLRGWKILRKCDKFVIQRSAFLQNPL